MSKKTDEMMKIGLVVLNYNDSETVISFLDKVRVYKSIDRIVVVDNCSTDGAYERIQAAIGKESAGSGDMGINSAGGSKSSGDMDINSVGGSKSSGFNDTNSAVSNKRCGGIDLIRAASNRGYAAGNNLGVRYLIENYSPDAIVISNPDVFFTEEMLTTLIDHLEKLPDAGLVSCRMNCMSGISMPSAWKLPRFVDCLFQDSFIIKKIFGDATEYSPEHFTGDVSRVDVVQGSFFAFRPKTFEEAGGFDEHTFLYFEESILARRIKNTGKTGYLINTCSYDHYHSVSINKNIDSVKKRFEIAYRSRLWYCKEYLHINRFQELLMGIFHRLGVFNYLVYKMQWRRS